MGTNPEELQEVVANAQKIRKDSAGKPIRLNDGKEHSFIVDNDSMTATNLKTVREVDCGDVVVQVNEVNAPKGSTIAHTHPSQFGPPGQACTISGRLEMSNDGHAYIGKLQLADGSCVNVFVPCA